MATNHRQGKVKREKKKRKKCYTFANAREIARKLGLTCLKEWQIWSKDKSERGRVSMFPLMPSSPATRYKNEGWRGWGDFLGTGNTRGGSQRGKRKRKRKQTNYDTQPEKRSRTSSVVSLSELSTLLQSDFGRITGIGATMVTKTKKTVKPKLVRRETITPGPIQWDHDAEDYETEVSDDEYSVYSEDDCDLSEGSQSSESESEDEDEDNDLIDTMNISRYKVPGQELPSKGVVREGFGRIPGPFEGSYVANGQLYVDV